LSVLTGEFLSLLGLRLCKASHWRVSSVWINGVSWRLVSFLSIVLLSPFAVAQTTPPMAPNNPIPWPDNRAPLQAVQTSERVEEKASFELRLDQLSLQKKQIQQNFEQKNLDCSRKFAVTGCKIDALREKNESMAIVKKEEAQISQEQKRLRSEQKRQEISWRESPEELERAREKAQVAQDNYDERTKAHAQRVDEHERQLNAEGLQLEDKSPEQRALERQAGAKSAQETHDEKIRKANAHRQEHLQRLSTKTLHPKPLPVPDVPKPSDSPRPNPLP